jgi:hypothetical protein
MTARASQSTTWSLASQNRSVEYAPNQSSFCQSGGATPSSVGSRYMFGSHTYWRWYTSMQKTQPIARGKRTIAARARVRRRREPAQAPGGVTRQATSRASAAPATQRISIASTCAKAQSRPRAPTATKATIDGRMAARAITTSVHAAIAVAST